MGREGAERIHSQSRESQWKIMDKSILRVDTTTSKSRTAVQPAEPSSPQPSVDRLSVSFAPPTGVLGGGGGGGSADDRSWESVEGDYYPDNNTTSNHGDKYNYDNLSDVSKVNVFNMASDDPGNTPSGNRLSAVMTDEEDDYSASINAILHRRASARKVKGLGKRRTSSPMDSDRRRSSVFTTSSGDTAITMDEGGMGQEQIFENIRLHKEVLESVKQQPWEMRRKLKLVQQAKEYVRRHEGQLQERLAQSKNTKDIMARFNIIIIRQWQYLKREMANMASNMIPWERRIKEIESHFGSVVASYFTFLRWIFWINIVIAATLICFVIVPELVAADPTVEGSDRRKFPMKSEEKTAGNLRTLWDFEGVLKYSPIFYGYFTDQHETKEGYPLPLGYFITGLAVYVYSFVAILRRMADNSRQSKLSEKDDECIFSWKVFTGWDYMIGNPETAFNRFASITMGFKEALLEEKEKKKDERNWKIIGLRILANFLVLLLLITSAWAVVLVVGRSEQAERDNLTSWWRQNEITVVMSLITTIFPNIFELIGMMEKYHPRRQLRWQLARIMMLNFLNLYTLIIALFGKVINMTAELEALRPNTTATPSLSTTMTSMVMTTLPPCADVDVLNCTMLDEYRSLWAMKNTNATVTFTSNVMTLTPISSNFSLGSNDTFTLLSSARLNATELWKLFHHLSPKTDLSKVINATLSNPDVWESIYQTMDNENLTYYWPHDSEFNLSDSQVLLPKNKTALAAALPWIIQVITAHLRNTIPSLVKTTPFLYLNYSSTTKSPDNLTTTLATTSSTEFPFNLTTDDEDMRTYPWNFTPTKPQYFKNYYEFEKASTTPYSVRLPRKRRQFKGLRGGGGERGLTNPPNSDYQSTDISGEYTGEKDEDYYDGSDNNLQITSTNGLYGTDGKSSTRGDITIETEEGSTSTTTMSPSTTPMPTESDEELQKFLTQIVTDVTMYLTRNSTKYDDAERTSLMDFTKMVSTVFTRIDTWKTTTPNFNSTFYTNYQTRVEDKKKTLCKVQICEDGTSNPEGLKEAFNCSDFVCLLNILAGPRDDGCWVENTKLCIQSTPIPTTQNSSVENKLRRLCWETMFGQELVKLTVMDLVFTVAFIFVIDFFRAILVRVLNPCWCWDLEKQFPQYGDFKIAENILHLVNNQGMIWMGMFFSPGLPAINLVKLVILLYIRSWAVMTCNVPHETVFRASRSNNFYFALLLFMLFLCTLPVGYAIVWLPPSWQCGPFSRYARIFHIFTQALFRALPVKAHEAVRYMASPGIVIPLLVLLVLIIYYLLSLTGALREANNDLKIQLRRERTEERRKMFRIAGGKKKEDTPFNRWKTLIPAAAKAAASPDDPQSQPTTNKPSVLTTGKQTGFAGMAKRAALKAKKHQEDDGNATDNDQVSLPEDQPQQHKAQKPPYIPRKPSCTDSIASTRSEIPVIKISKDVDNNKAVPGPSTSTTTTSSTTAVPGPSKGIEPTKKARVMRALINAAKGRSREMLKGAVSKIRSEEETIPLIARRQQPSQKSCHLLLDDESILEVDEFDHSDVRPFFVRFQTGLPVD